MTENPWSDWLRPDFWPGDYVLDKRLRNLQPSRGTALADLEPPKGLGVGLGLGLRLESGWVWADVQDGI